MKLSVIKSLSISLVYSQIYATLRGLKIVTLTRVVGGRGRHHRQTGCAQVAHVCALHVMRKSARRALHLPHSKHEPGSVRPLADHVFAKAALRSCFVECQTASRSVRSRSDGGAGQSNGRTHGHRTPHSSTQVCPMRTVSALTKVAGNTQPFINRVCPNCEK